MVLVNCAQDRSKEAKQTKNFLIYNQAFDCKQEKYLQKTCKNICRVKIK